MINWVVGLIGCVVLVGHVFEWQTVTAVLPGAVDMMPLTALNFVIASIVGILLDRSNSGLFRDATVVSLGAFIVITMLSVLVAFGVVVVPWGSPRVHMAVGEGVPSLGTAAGFLLFAVAAWSVLHGRNPRVPALAMCGLAATAVTGYVLGIPTLYFHSPELSTAMAIHTAACTGLLGVHMLRRPA